MPSRNSSRSWNDLVGILSWRIALANSRCRQSRGRAARRSPWRLSPHPDGLGAAPRELENARGTGPLLSRSGDTELVKTMELFDSPGLPLRKRRVLRWLGSQLVPTQAGWWHDWPHSTVGQHPAVFLLSRLQPHLPQIAGGGNQSECPPELLCKMAGSTALALAIMPPISLLAPAHNEERSIVESVRSLLRLDYSEFEVIVTNDGSKDGTLAQLSSTSN